MRFRHRVVISWRILVMFESPWWGSMGTFVITQCFLDQQSQKLLNLSDICLHGKLVSIVKECNFFTIGFHKNSEMCHTCVNIFSLPYRLLTYYTQHHMYTTKWWNTYPLPLPRKWGKSSSFTFILNIYHSYGCHLNSRAIYHSFFWMSFKW